MAPICNASGPSLCRDCISWFSNGPLDCPICGSIRIINHSELADLCIAHIDCDAFYAAVEKRDNPALRDKPVIVGGAGARSVVTTACYIARQFGVHSAMPMYKAKKLCPGAVIISPNMRKYREASRQIRNILLSATSLIQTVSLDEAYLDLSIGVREDSAELPALVLARIAEKIEEVIGITASIGLANNKFLAKLASDLEKPRGFSVIGQKEAFAFLSGLSVKKINGVGAVTARKMASQGIETIGQLQALSEDELVACYGKFGRRLAKFVQGKDDRKVCSGRSAKSISAERTFIQDLRDSEALKAEVMPLCERVCARLRDKSVAGASISLKLKTTDFQIVTRNRQLSSPTQRASLIYQHVAALIDAEADGRTFRLIGVGVADLSSGFSADPPELFKILPT